MTRYGSILLCINSLCDKPVNIGESNSRRTKKSFLNPCLICMDRFPEEIFRLVEKAVYSWYYKNNQLQSMLMHPLKMRTAPPSKPQLHPL